MVDQADGSSGEDWQALGYRVGFVFTPAAPVDHVSLFAGRRQQMQDLLDVVFQRGQHAVIYGERGVGKTSLASVMHEVLGDEKGIALRTNCDGTDTFSSIWHKLLDELQVRSVVEGAGFTPQLTSIVHSAAEMLPDEENVTPNDVRRTLQVLAGSGRVVIFIDEFDRVDSSVVRTLVADTIKSLSDQLVNATVVLIGVADTVDELIAEHQSVERALVQIHMPRMSYGELAEIVTRGLARVKMDIAPDALKKIALLSQGLPHYTHLLALWSARSAVSDQRTIIELADVDAGTKSVLTRSQESVISAYVRATASPRDNLYRQVLLACALAQKDDLGYFAAADVRAPLSAIMRKPYDIPAFARHLNAFSDQQRGPVIQKKGIARRFRFRFINPLLQPYVVMRGLAEGMIDAYFLEEHQR